MDQAEFKEKYYQDLLTIVTECVYGDTGSQAVLVVHTPRMRTVAVYTINADIDDTRGMLVNAAETYSSYVSEGRTLN